MHYYSLVRHAAEPIDLQWPSVCAVGGQTQRRRRSTDDEPPDGAAAYGNHQLSDVDSVQNA